MQKFNPVSIDHRLVLHSHLPALNTAAFKRFVSEHLLARSPGPSHAQIGITSDCPQQCEYCYNKSRSGSNMDKETIKKVVKDLRKMGVVWLGLTGGEPLLNKDIVEIVESAGDGVALKLFTGGYNLNRILASNLIKAGLFYVSVSLDHWREEEHDRIRGCRGSFRTALKAIDIFNKIGGIHVGVSTVLSRSMLQDGQVDEFIQFLIELGVHEAWLSEIKPATQPLWNEEVIITADEQSDLIKLQDRYNKEGKITVNYLGHFECGGHFGCNAGHKMVYVDAFGEVSPCVFSPITFGNVNGESVECIFKTMRQYFRPQNLCFVNTNYDLFARFYQGRMPIERDDTIQLMQHAKFGTMPEFFRLYYK